MTPLPVTTVTSEAVSPLPSISMALSPTQPHVMDTATAVQEAGAQQANEAARPHSRSTQQSMGPAQSLVTSKHSSAASVPTEQLAQFRDVQVVVSRGALQGWVEQASPACGAASVAGAWNAVKPSGHASWLNKPHVKILANTFSK